MKELEILRKLFAQCEINLLCGIEEDNIKRQKQRD